MILKYETRKGKWKFLDKLRLCEYEMINKSQRQGDKFKACEYVYKETNDKPGYDENAKFAYINIQYLDFSNKIICTSALAYLLNDEGKTIERIN